MLDPAVVEECMHCLLGAAVHDGAKIDLALTATALARELADTQDGQAVATLDAAANQAARYLEASDLVTDPSAALSRLTTFRACVHATLVCRLASVEAPPLIGEDQRAAVKRQRAKQARRSGRQQEAGLR